MTIPATDKRGHVDVKYLPEVLSSQDDSPADGEAALVFNDVEDGMFVARIPKFAADCIFEHADGEHVVDGGAKDISQHTLIREVQGRRMTVLEVTFHAPFFCPPDDEPKRKRTFN